MHNRSVLSSNDEKVAASIKKAALYFKCGDHEQGRRIKEEMSAKAIALGFDIVGCYFDRIDKPPHTLLSLAEIKNTDTRITLAVNSMECLEFEDVDRRAIMRYLKSYGVSILPLDGTISTSPIEYLIKKINKYVSCDIDTSNGKMLNDRVFIRTACVGKLPFGYVQNGELIEVEPNEALIINDVFDMFASGVSPSKIIKCLEEKYRGEKLPVRNQIYKLIENKRYIGIDNTEVGAYPAIINDRAFILAASARERSARTVLAHEFLLNRVLWNGDIRMEPSYEKRGARKAIYSSELDNGIVSIQADELERNVKEYIENEYLKRIDEMENACESYLNANKSKCAELYHKACSKVNEIEAEARQKYARCDIIPNKKGIDELEDSRVRARLYRIEAAFEKEQMDLFGIDNGAVRLFFDHFKNFASLSAIEKSYFINIVVRSVCVSEDEICLNTVDVPMKRVHLKYSKPLLKHIKR